MFFLWHFTHKQNKKIAHFYHVSMPNLCHNYLCVKFYSIQWFKNNKKFHFPLVISLHHEDSNETLQAVLSLYWVHMSEVLTQIYIQSTLIISTSKGPSEILRDIRTSTYQICRTEEKII